MAGISGDLCTISLRYRFQGQLCQNTQHYGFSTAVAGTVTAANIGEAWWNHVKGAWRALIVNDPSFTFDSVAVEELGGGLNFGEYGIPAGERAGTRPLGSLGAWLPSFVAVGTRLTVATRVTRPGQKRFPGVTEGDSEGGTIAAAFKSLVEAVAVHYASPITLGAPALAEGLYPVVARYAVGNPVPIAFQPVTGYVVNSVTTSQVSRRFGRGQ